MCGIKQNLQEAGMNECGCGGNTRKLLTRQEKKEKLRKYQKELELELEAVKETLQALNEELPEKPSGLNKKLKR